MVKINVVAYDPADYLTTPELVREYLQAAWEEDDVDYFIQALGDAMRSGALTELAQKPLFAPLCTDKHPSFESVYKVLKSLDMHLNTV